MTEVDIWIKVFDKLGFKFIDEYCGPGDINQIKYSLDKDIYIYSLYFNRKIDEVSSLFVTTGGTTKQSFYNQYIDVFREVKLENLV
jgi:hypothetical protein